MKKALVVMSVFLVALLFGFPISAATHGGGHGGGGHGSDGVSRSGGHVSGNYSGGFSGGNHSPSDGVSHYRGPSHSNGYGGRHDGYGSGHAGFRPGFGSGWRHPSGAIRGGFRGGVVVGGIYTAFWWPFYALPVPMGYYGPYGYPSYDPNYVLVVPQGTEQQPGPNQCYGPKVDQEGSIIRDQAGNMVPDFSKPVPCPSE